MKNRVKYLFSLVALIALSIAIPLDAQPAAQFAHASWALPSEICGPDQNCEIRLSLEGDLFIYSFSGATFYVSRQGETTYRAYNLQPYVRWITGGLMDFVPFSNYDAVLFFGSGDGGTLSRLDLTTGQMILMPQSDIGRRVLECNGYSGRRGNHYRISRLGTGSQLLVCSLDDDGNFLVNIVDVVTQQTLHSYNFELPWNGIGQPRSWNMLLGGQDGNIYLDAIGIDQRIIWQQLAGPVPEMPAWGWRLYRYEVSSGTWSVRNILPEQMSSANYPPPGSSINARVAAVLTNGDIIYQHEWRQTLREHGMEVSQFSPDFQLLQRITNEGSEASLSYAGITEDGLVLLRDGGRIDTFLTQQLTLTN